MSFTSYLILGSNLGDRAGHLYKARILIRKAVGEILSCSSIHRSAPVGYDSTSEYFNQALKITTKLSPDQLLLATQKIEKQLGRTQKSKDGIYQDRTIDIDILYYEDLVVDLPNLKIPHPRIQERDFVKIPLSEIY